MRMLAGVLVLISLFVSAAFAQQKEASVPAEQKQEAPQATKAMETAAGTVDSISPISPEMGATEGTVIIVDAAGDELSFTINENTVILDESANKIESDDITDGNKVSISYLKSDMGNIAATISKIKEIKK